MIFLKLYPFRLLVFLLAFGFASHSVLAQADGAAGAEAAYRAGDYATAASLWRQLAESGDPAAQYNYGRMLYYGQGVPQDRIEAYKWFLIAAESDLAQAQEARMAIFRALTTDELREAVRRAGDWRLAHDR
jgi:hypothetical protein